MLGIWCRCNFSYCFRFCHGMILSFRRSWNSFAFVAGSLVLSLFFLAALGHRRGAIEFFMTPPMQMWVSWLNFSGSLLRWRFDVVIRAMVQQLMWFCNQSKFPGGDAVDTIWSAWWLLCRRFNCFNYLINKYFFCLDSYFVLMLVMLYWCFKFYLID